VTADILLGLLALALVAALILRERAHDAERRELLDRIQNPDAARTAAFARQIGASPVIPNTDLEDDEKFGRVLDDELIPYVDEV
jgi:hypothetical protein